ncbi:MAG: hypothetical protein PUB87_05950 [Eubacteriaceae bacterium]|nr:hypothetical protein [Eubacteriaceae bacterium]
MEKKSRMHISNVGLVSLFMIFIVICMIVLSLLTLSEARKDYKFSSTLADHNQTYYEAVNKAERQIALVDEDLRTGKRSLGSEDVTFQVEIDENQAILVKLSVDNYPCEIKTYKTVRTGEWHGKNAAQLMNVER